DDVVLVGGDVDDGVVDAQADHLARPGQDRRAVDACRPGARGEGVGADDELRRPDVEHERVQRGGGTRRGGLGARGAELGCDVRLGDRCLEGQLYARVVTRGQDDGGQPAAVAGTLRGVTSGIGGARGHGVGRDGLDTGQRPDLEVPCTTTAGEHRGARVGARRRRRRRQRAKRAEAQSPDPRDRM
ncbi:MAG: hypothetical protein AVDCRST_MAG53-2521, partial [uncultured Solirubrobacteraceae bacterium]